MINCLDAIVGITVAVVVCLLWLCIPLNVVFAMVLAYYGETFAAFGALASAVLCGIGGYCLLSYRYRTGP